MSKINELSKKIVTFGEIMLRLSTPDYQTINQTTSYIANYGGGEANVAVSLAHMGHKTSFVTKLPPNQLGDGAIEHLRKNGVDTSHIVRGSDTLGIYFLESGFGGRSSKVIYNRKNSAITTIKLSEVDLEKIFDNASWFHVSGISLALNKNVADFAIECAKYCSEHNIKVSFDFNYRQKLWTIEESKKVYKAMMPYVDVVFSSFFDCNTILEIPTTNGQDNLPLNIKRRDVFKRTLEKYNLSYIFGTDRTVHSASENSLSAYAYSKNKEELADPIRFMIYDRIGGGDAFASGIIHGLLRDFDDPGYALKFGLSTSVLKHTLYGDACVLSVNDIENFMRNQSLEVQR